LLGKDDDQCQYCGANLIGVVGELEVATPQMAQAVAEGLNYYEVLSVDEYANQDELELAYNCQLEHWLLTSPAMAEEAAHKIELVKEAYEVLSDPARRATYDTTLKWGVQYASGKTPDTNLDGPEVLAHGKGLLTVKMYDQALAVFEKACRLMPESAEAHYLYAASCLEAEGENIFGIAANVCQKIIKEANTALALDPGLSDAAAYKALAQALYLKQCGQAGEARTQVVDAIRHKPDWVLPYHVLAGFAFQAGDTDWAEKSCRQALKLDPDNANVQFILANVYRRTGREREAEQLEREKNR
jgi:tetratricopeptide (TPR) repeat protein